MSILSLQQQFIKFFQNLPVLIQFSSSNFQNSYNDCCQPQKSADNIISIQIFRFESQKKITIVNSIYSLQNIEMQLLKKLQQGMFQRILQLQNGKMQSKTVFIISQILKLIFKDACLLVIFLLPIAQVQQFLSNLFVKILDINTIITITTTFLLSSFIFILIVKIEISNNRLKFLKQMFVPWLDIFTIPIIIITINLILVNIGSNIILAICNIITIIFTCVIHIFYNLYNFTKAPRTKNLLNKRQAYTISISNILLIFFCLYLSAKYFGQQSFSATENIVYGVIHFCISGIKLKQRIFLRFYLDSFAHNVSTYFYFMELNLSILIMMINLFQINILSQNLAFLLIIMTMLSYTSLKSYIQKRNNNMYLSKASQIKNENDAILYLDCLNELCIKVQNEQQDIILISLKRKHNLNCKIVTCFCQKDGKSLGDFIKDYVKCQLEEMIDIFHNVPSILISILYFKLVIFKYYPQILNNINNYSTHFNLSFTERFYKYALSNYVSDFIDKKNTEINAVNSQEMFKLEEMRGQIEKIIKSEIQIRNKKWRYLSRGLCRVSQLEHSCNISLKYITRIMKICSQFMPIFKKSKEFNLLILFYFLKVSFLGNGNEIKENLKEIYYGYKEDELYSLKEFKKFIFHKRSCVIETLVDTKSMGIVTAVSRSVEDMFGFPVDKIMGISINNLMPSFMAEQHQNILSEWGKSGTWRTIGKLKQIFCIHKQQFCFSALIYLKIYIKDNAMHFITNIFKLNDNDYMVVNPKSMKIEGLGKKFLKFLGDPAKKLSLDIVMQNNNDILFSKEAAIAEKLYRKVFLSTRSLEKQVNTYLQKNAESQGNQNKINQQFNKRLSQISTEKYYIEFQIKIYNMGRIHFYLIKLKQSKKIEHKQTRTFIQRPPTIIPENSREIMELDGLSSENSNNVNDEDERAIIQHNANSSMSSLSQKQNYPLSKIIQKILFVLQHPQKIKDNRLNKYNLLIIAFLIFLSTIGFISIHFYNLGLLSIQGIFFADGAVSDIMQTTEISYGQLYLLKSQLMNGTITDFNSTYTSITLILNYVYGLKYYDFENLIEKITELNNIRFYSYLQKSSTWIMNGKQVLIDTNQFLQNMYYLTKQILAELENMQINNQKVVNLTFFQTIFNNFGEMQRINEYYLNDYQGICDDTHNLLSILTIISMILYSLVSLALGVALNHYFKFRFNQVINSFTFFSFISSHYIEKMKDYYSMLIVDVVQTDKLKIIDLQQQQLFQIDTYDLFHKSQNTKSYFTKIKFINYENYYKWIFIVIAVLFVNGINYLATAQVINFFPTSKLVISEINQLMRSQNKLIESYYELKSSYYLNPSTNMNSDLYDKLITYMNQSEVKFNAVANQLSTMFSAYDPNYQDNFVNSLITGVCKLSAPLLSSFQNMKCVKQLKLNILSGGILISMNFFQRNVREALEDLNMQYILKTKSQYKGDYFQQLDYVQLDKMMIYMFKVYQTTQAIIFNSYIQTINVVTDNYLIITFSASALFILIMIIWLKSINSQKQNLSLLYGHLLLVPFMILKSNNRIVSSLKQALEYEDY